MTGTRMAGVVGVVAALAIWSAASANPQTMSISVSPDRGMPGTTVNADGAGCEWDGEAWEYVRIAFDSAAKTPNGVPTYTKFFPEEHPVRPDGTWTGKFTVPADAPLGDYDVTSQCSGSDQVIVSKPVRFTVGEPLPPTTTTPPPPTTEAATTTPPVATTTTAKPKAATTTTTPPAAAATTPTTTTQAAIATTTTEPPPGREVAAPASATKRASGTPALAAASAAVLAASCGALAVRTARRRRARLQ